MFCRICGEEIPEQEICPKCGCLTGYHAESAPAPKRKPLDPFRISCFAAIAVVVLAVVMGIISPYMPPFYPVQFTDLFRTWGYPLLAIGGYLCMCFGKEKLAVVSLIAPILDHVLLIVQSSNAATGTRHPEVYQNAHIMFTALQIGLIALCVWLAVTVIRNKEFWSVFVIVILYVIGWMLTVEFRVSISGNSVSYFSLFYFEQGLFLLLAKLPVIGLCILHLIKNLLARKAAA